MRLLCAFVLLGTFVWSAGEKHEDMMHPRSPQTPLEVEFAPWYCATCVEEGRIKEEKRELTFLRRPLEEIVDLAGIRKSKYYAIQTPHFKILSELRGTKIKPNDSRYNHADFVRLQKIFPKIKLGLQGTVVNAHERAHLYHIRIERVYSHFRALTGNKKRLLGMRAPYELLVFDDYASHHAVQDKLIGRTNDKAGVRHHVRGDVNFMVFTTAESVVPAKEKALCGHVVHGIAHNLVDGHGNYYRETPAWLEEGLAHYYERLHNPKHNTFCWSEGKPPSLFQKPRWERTIRNLVLRKKDRPLGSWCEKKLPGELSGLEQGVCWSIVQWMVTTDPVRFTKMLDKLQDYKTKPSSAETIQHGFGVSPNVLHERWRKWVLENYSKKK